MTLQQAPVRVAIVGAGAIGGVMAARLATLPDVRLSVLARGATLHALQRDGLRLTDADGSRTIALLASDDPADLGPQDLVIVAVKGPALAAVAPKVGSLLAADGLALIAMNGLPWWFFNGLGGACDGLALQSVDPNGSIAAAIPASQVIGSVVHMSCATTAPGQVQHRSGNGLIIGEPRGGNSARVDVLSRLLGDAGFAVTVSERIQYDIWYKLWGNMTMNPVSALTGATCDRILADPLTRSFVSAVMLEAQAVGAHIGCAIDQTPEDRHAVTAKLGAFKTSMLQDVEAGRAIELDALLSSVREVAQHLGLPKPHTDALLGLTRLMAQTHGLYPN
jgi:2-dehydropantoate 2-reductase